MRGVTQHPSSVWAWTSIALGSGMMVSGWSALQTQATYGQLRETLGRDPAVADLQSAGQQYALIAGATLASGVLLNLTGAYLLQRVRTRTAIEKLAGGQP